MIVASPKPITELKQLIDRHKKVLFVGCGTCVTVCLAGGEREVGIAGYATRMARKRTDRIREMLEEIGVGADRLRMVNLSAAMAPTFVESVQQIVDTVKALGPSPLRDAPQPEKARVPESEG